MLRHFRQQGLRPFSQAKCRDNPGVPFWRPERQRRHKTPSDPGHHPGDSKSTIYLTMVIFGPTTPSVTGHHSTTGNVHSHHTQSAGAPLQNEQTGTTKQAITSVQSDPVAASEKPTTVRQHTRIRQTSTDPCRVYTLHIHPAQLPQPSTAVHTLTLIGGATNPPPPPRHGMQPITTHESTCQHTRRRCH